MRTASREKELNALLRAVFNCSYIFVIIILFFIAFYESNSIVAFSVVVIMVSLRFLAIWFNKHLKKRKLTPVEHSDSTNQEAQTPIYIHNISSSIPQAQLPRRPPTPPSPGSSMSPPSGTGQLTPPTLPRSRSSPQASLSLSEQLSYTYYSQSSSFSSPYIASHSATQAVNNSVPSFSSSQFRSSSLASFHSNYGHPTFTNHADREAAARIAANLQPPAYPDVVEEGPGLLPPPYTTPATAEEPEMVFGPSTDGLPSYEVAISTWQPPADTEHPTPQDNLPMTND